MSFREHGNRFTIEVQQLRCHFLDQPISSREITAPVKLRRGPPAFWDSAIFLISPELLYYLTIECKYGDSLIR